tara:strand:+ start:1318 stop:1590 length:273 start_codon:yes stop_codon:yes gene_type:complete
MANTPLLRPKNILSALISLGMQVNYVSKIEGRGPREAFLDFNVELPKEIPDNWESLGISNLVNIEHITVDLSHPDMEFDVEIVQVGEDHE